VQRDESKAAIDYQLSRKRPMGRPRKRWVDGVCQDLKTLVVGDWKDVIQDRERWKALAVAAKTQDSSFKKKKKYFIILIIEYCMLLSKNSNVNNFYC